MLGGPLRRPGHHALDEGSQVRDAAQLLVEPHRADAGQASLGHHRDRLSQGQIGAAVQEDEPEQRVGDRDLGVAELGFNLLVLRSQGFVVGRQEARDARATRP